MFRVPLKGAGAKALDLGSDEEQHDKDASVGKAAKQVPHAKPREKEEKSACSGEGAAAAGIAGVAQKRRALPPAEQRQQQQQSDERAAKRSARAAQAQQRHTTQRAAARATAAHDAEVALTDAAKRAFHALVVSGAGTGEREGKEQEVDEPEVLTVEGLRAALQRFRVPDEICQPQEAEDMLALALQRIGKESAGPGPLDLSAFRAFFATLGLQVSRDGRVW